MYVLLLDASKAFDKVSFNMLFNKLRDRSMCPRITKLQHHIEGLELKRTMSTLVGFEIIEF